MQIPIADPSLVAASALKSAYLAVFSLFGHPGGYTYVQGAALRPVRQLIREPFRRASDSVGSYVMAAPKEGIPPEADIMLVTDPHPCWIVRVHGHHVFLPLDWDGTECAPLGEWYIRKHRGETTLLEVAGHWPYQAFGTMTTVPVHLQGADRLASLVGRTIGGTLPTGNPLRGACVRHNGENAMLLCEAGGPVGDTG